MRLDLHVPALVAALLAAPSAVSATPVAYRLETDRSVVGFETDFGKAGLVITGKMPVAAAELLIDFDSVAATRIDVTVDAADATTSNPLATQAMTGASVLDIREFPTIRFASTRVRSKGVGAEVTGNITLRGVTKPITFAAQFYRQKGTQVGDRANLSIVLTGALSRSDFGAGGFPDMVGDEVRLKILARITRGD